MESKDIIAIGVMAVFVIYGLVNLIGLPILVRRFYTKHQFADTGSSLLDSPSESILLDSIVTKRLYRGHYRDQTIFHAKAMLKKPSLLTFSKNKRKQLQIRWSVTQLCVEQELTDFALFPKTDPGTVLLMTVEAGVDLSDDEVIDQRYFCRTEQPEFVVPLICGPLKEFLLSRHVAFIEVIENTVIIKRVWPTEKFEASTLDEFNAAVEIANHMRA